MNEHTCTPTGCPAPGVYYVTAVDGPSYWLMAGPYETHPAALAQVDRARTIATDADARAWWKAWGTARVKDGSTEPGVLNKRGLL